MKKQLFVLAVLFGAANLYAAPNHGMYGASTADLSGRPGARVTTNVNYEKYETRSTKTAYSAEPKNKMYYQGAKRSDLYRNMDESQRTIAKQPSKEKGRKYYIAHPFFQPTKGKIGSITDLSYSMSSFDFNAPAVDPAKGEWKTNALTVKEDLSFGITDKLALMGMAQYRNVEDEMAFNGGASGKNKSSKIDAWGLGAQWRFVDNSEYIAMLYGAYQNYPDAANAFVGSMMAGYKINTTTLYGLGRIWQINFKGDSYGNSMTLDGGESSFLAFHHGNDKASAGWLEAGAGLFSVIEKDWTLNLEAVMGSYDWHSAATVKAAFGWQPLESFALNAYVKALVYDSADGKDVAFYQTVGGLWNPTGAARISGVAETTLGLQAMLLF